MMGIITTKTEISTKFSSLRTDHRPGASVPIESEETLRSKIKLSLEARRGLRSTRGSANLHPSGARQRAWRPQSQEPAKKCFRET
jgi:hypothetical protein